MRATSAIWQVVKRGKCDLVEAVTVPVSRFGSKSNVQGPRSNVQGPRSKDQGRDKGVRRQESGFQVPSSRFQVGFGFEDSGFPATPGREVSGSLPSSRSNVHGPTSKVGTKASGVRDQGFRFQVQGSRLVSGSKIPGSPPRRAGCVKGPTSQILNPGRHFLRTCAENRMGGKCAESRGAGRC